MTKGPGSTDADTSGQEHYPSCPQKSFWFVFPPSVIFYLRGQFFRLAFASCNFLFFQKDILSPWGTSLRRTFFHNKKSFPACLLALLLKRYYFSTSKKTLWHADAPIPAVFWNKQLFRSRKHGSFAERLAGQVYRRAVAVLSVLSEPSCEKHCSSVRKVSCAASP